MYSYAKGGKHTYGISVRVEIYPEIGDHLFILPIMLVADVTLAVVADTSKSLVLTN